MPAAQAALAPGQWSSRCAFYAGGRSQRARDQCDPAGLAPAPVIAADAALSLPAATVLRTAAPPRVTATLVSRPQVRPRAARQSRARHGRGRRHAAHCCHGSAGVRIRPASLPRRRLSGAAACRRHRQRSCSTAAALRRSSTRRPNRSRCRHEHARTDLQARNRARLGRAATSNGWRHSYGAAPAPRAAIGRHVGGRRTRLCRTAAMISSPRWIRVSTAVRPVAVRARSVLLVAGFELDSALRRLASEAMAQTPALSRPCGRRSASPCRP